MKNSRKQLVEMIPFITKIRNPRLKKKMDFRRSLNGKRDNRECRKHKALIKNSNVFIFPEDELRDCACFDYKISEDKRQHKKQLIDAESVDQGFNILVDSLGNMMAVSYNSKYLGKRIIKE